jgi:hypothetical protein
MRFEFQTMLALASLWLVSTGTAWGQSGDGLARAGCPNQIARHARVPYGKSYVACYVGGGAPTPKGGPRCVDEGTFGVDYRPIIPGFRGATALGWWHGRRAQGGEGQYEPNAPVSPFAAKSSRRFGW